MYEPNVRDVGSLECFQELTESEVYKIIMSMTVKSCELDPITCKSIPQVFAEALTHSICHIVDISIRSNIFPNKEWKYAVMKLLLKKNGLELVEKNYRPVSNLSMTSKIITEKAMLKQIIDHLDQDAPLPDCQNAYRANHGCETALLELHNDILGEPLRGSRS